MVEVDDIVTAAAVAVWLKERIRRGVFVPGQRLVESDIMRATGASRGRVREALHRVATEGLVTIEEFRGASVKRLSRDEVRKIYAMREVLEGLAVRIVAETRDPKLMAELKVIQDELDRTEEARNADRYARANELWHATIIGGAGSEYLSAALERLRIPIFRIQFQAFHSQDLIQRANADHRMIGNLVRDGKSEAAEHEMRRHVRDGLAAIEGMEDDLFA